MNIGLLAEHAGAFTAISCERQRQIKLHGDNPKPLIKWLAITAEEFGELAKEINEGDNIGATNVEAVRDEAIQLAACAVALWESTFRSE
jgi:NTP pyrophosphatase (non-canonical NTP hydrolase)